jgi:monofunctional biosynthetic peptidoglycan transglycosylase
MRVGRRSRESGNPGQSAHRLPLGPRLRGGDGKIIRRLGRILLFALSGCLIGSVFLVMVYRVVPPPVTPLMLIRAVEGRGITKSWQPLDEISPNLMHAVMASEDAKFCEHHGFDWDAIGEAWQRYRRGVGKLHGASTISMQTAKNVFLWPGRDWIRKGLEAYFTVLIELVWGKRRIIETYLNVVEWGPGIYGAAAAAQFYFHKPPNALNAEEAARLAAILPDPLKWSASRPDRYVAERATFIRDGMPDVPLKTPACRSLPER